MIGIVLGHIYNYGLGYTQNNSFVVGFKSAVEKRLFLKRQFRKIFGMLFVYPEDYYKIVYQKFW